MKALATIATIAYLIILSPSPPPNLSVAESINKKIIPDSIACAKFLETLESKGIVQQLDEFYNGDNTINHYNHNFDLSAEIFGAIPVGSGTINMAFNDSIDSIVLDIQIPFSSPRQYIFSMTEDSAKYNLNGKIFEYVQIDSVWYLDNCYFDQGIKPGRKDRKEMTQHRERIGYKFEDALPVNALVRKMIDGEISDDVSVVFNSVEQQVPIDIHHPHSKIDVFSVDQIQFDKHFRANNILAWIYKIDSTNILVHSTSTINVRGFLDPEGYVDIKKQENPDLQPL